MEPIVNKKQLTEEDGMIEKIKQLLGLSADVSDEDVYSKIEQLMGASKKIEGFSAKFKEILSKLGLKEDAKPEEIAAKIDSLSAEDDKDTRIKDVTSELDLKEEATVEEIKAKIVALKKSQDLPEGVVAKKDFDALQDRIDKKERDEKVSDAIRAGKITSSQKEWAEKYALKNPEGFNAYIKNAPVVVDPSKIVAGKKDKDANDITEEDKKVAAMLDVSEEDLKNEASA